MPNEKITEMSSILAANLVDADVVEIVDISANGGAGTNFKITVGELRTLITNALIIGTDVQSWAAVLDATTASYTTALDTKLDGIEANADVTDADNVNSSGAVMESDYTPAFSLLVQQSGTGSPESLSIATGTIVGRITGGGSEIDDLSPTQVRLLLNVEDGADVTDTTNVTNAGALMDSEVTNLDEVKAFDSTDYAAALGVDDNYVTDAEKIVIGNTSGTNTGDQDISGKQDILSEGAFVDGDKTKLDGIEALADVTDATNVAATGAVIPTGTPDGTKFLRDDEVWTTIPGGGDALTSNPLSQFAETTSLQLLGIISDETGTGALVFGTSPTLVTPNLGTPSVLVGTNITGTAAGLTVGATTGVEAGADVTDTANVTAAGALMDSEVTNLAQVKAFDTTDYATSVQGTTADNALPKTGGAMTGAITTTSTFDGRDVATDGTKLDTINVADITANTAKITYPSADSTKLAGIEALADVTDATNIASSGGVIPTGTPDGTKFLRDDQVWTAIAAGGDALTSNPLSQFAATTSAQLLGVMSDETGTGALVFGTSPTLVTPNLGTPSTLVGTNITGTAAGLTVGATTGVEAGADVTDTDNVTAAGALMDSEVTNLAQVKAFDSADYATAIQGTLATNALPKTGGAMTGAITTTSTFDGRDVATDGIKLDGIEALADVTDATNIASAGGVIPTGTPDGSKFLRDDQVWTAIAAGGVTIGDAVGGSSINTLLFSDGSGNLGNNTKLTFNGTSFNYTGNSSTSVTCTSLGTNAGNGNASNENTSIGNIANQSSSGLRKTAVGNNAGNASSGNEGTFLGADSGKSSAGTRNNFVGYRSGMNSTGSGYLNGHGDYTFFAASGTQNGALGYDAQNSSTGSYNSSVGARSMRSNNGSNNSAVGYKALESNTGSNVLALGDLAGWTNTQSNRTIIGQSNLPKFTGATVAAADAAAAAALPAASANGVYLYWNDVDNTIKARP